MHYSLDGGSEALYDLPGDRAHEMEPQDLLGCFPKGHRLQVAVSNVALRYEELGRFVVCVIHFDVVSAVSKTLISVCILYIYLDYFIL